MSERLTIVCFSSQPWEDGMWTNKQHVMSRVSQEHRVIFVNFGSSSPFKFVKRARARHADYKGRWLLHRPARRSVHSNLDVLDVWAPTWLGWLNRGHALRQRNDFERRVDIVGRWLSEQGIHDVVVWVYHPGYGASVARLRPRLVVYDCVDEYSAFPEFRDAKAWIAARERELCSVADVVTCTAPALFEAKRSLAPGRTHLVHNVGDFEHFQRAGRDDTPLPPELTDVAGPIVGFIGAVSDYKLNIDWLLALSQQRPDVTLVVIGPAGIADPDTDVGRLRARSNVLLLGHRDYESLPSYLKAFDVAVIPYRLNPYTQAVFPIKFFEFLATGKPVVISALPAVRDYWAAVLVANSAEEFVQACDRALTADSAEARSERVELARQNSWPARVKKLLGLVEQALASKV